VAKAYAYLIVGLRFPVILGWGALVVLAVLFLPPLPSSGGLADLIPAGSAAAQADASAARLFGYPLEAGIAIVQSHPRNLPQAVVDKTARAADKYDHQASIPGLLAVIPIPNGAGIPQTITVSPASAAGLLAGVRQRTSTIVTYLEFSANSTMQQQVADAGTYAHRLPDVIGVTGPVAAQYEQGLIIDRDLVWVELFTLLAIALIVGARFRSLLAPLAVLACAGTAYALAVRLVAWGAQRIGIALPQGLTRSW
jgi:RND superfamily putative drug exporter